MTSKLILSFFTGAIVGSVTTYYIVKPRYELVTEKTIFEDAPKPPDEKKTPKTTQDKPDLMEYAKKTNPYVSYNSIKSEQKNLDISEETYEEFEDVCEEVEENEESDPEYDERPPINKEIRKKPRIIKPNMFGNRYPDSNGNMIQPDTVSYTMFADGVIINDEWTIVNENIDWTIGYINLSPEHFEEYDSGVVYVRNDNMDILTDYEIVSDPRTYASISRGIPLED